MLWPIFIMVLEGFGMDLGPVFSGRGISFAGQIAFYSGGFAPTLRHYIIALLPYNFPRLILNSAIISTLSLCISMPVGIPAAYVLARRGFRGKSALAFLILSLRTISPFAVVIPFLVLYTQTGLWDTHIGLSLVYLVLNLPIVVWMMRGFLGEVPKEYYELAEVEGASDIAILRKVALPMTKAGLVATAIFAFVASWNEYLFAAILTGPSAKTVSRGVVSPPGAGEGLASFRIPEFDSLSVAGVLALIPAVLLILLIRRLLVKGITLGATRVEDDLQ